MMDEAQHDRTALLEVAEANVPATGIGQRE
jgi:hypothetical protein